MTAERALALSINLLRLGAWAAVLHLLLSLAQGQLALDAGLLAFLIIPGLRQRQITAARWGIAFGLTNAIICLGIGIALAFGVMPPALPSFTFLGFLSLRTPTVSVAVVLTAAVGLLDLWQACLLMRNDVRILMRVPDVAATAG